MSASITYKKCPLCFSDSITKSFLAKDFSVSKKEFEIWQCHDCTLEFTQNIPTIDGIGDYYNSENYVSHTDTSKGIINKLYHIARNITLKNKERLVKDSTHLQNGSLLDVGAGTGAFANFMNHNGWKIKGIEPSESARKIALEKYRITLDAPIGLKDFSNSTFDAITLWHVLEHVHELHNYMNIFYGLLKEKGCLFIAVPNYTSYDAGHYGKFWAAYDVPRHLYHFSPQSMARLAAIHKFRIRQYKPMFFDSFYVSMLSESYINNKPNLLRSFWIGTLSNFKTMFDIKFCSSIIYILEKRD